MKEQKYGVSLMVLILTVIIMVILAGTVIISLNNAGVINRAQGTVDEYNLKQVEELANLAWGEAYLAGNTTQNKLSEYVINYLTKNGVDTTKYYIEVTTKGVTVKDYAEYEENGWYKAWTCTKNVWSDEKNPGDALNGDVIAKLYKTDETDKYDLIISGTGEMGPIWTYNDDIWDYDIWAYGNEFMRKLRHVIIKDGVKSIGEFAFRGSTIESIKIPNTVTSIEAAAFGRCNSLLNLTIPSSVNNIDVSGYDIETLEAAFSPNTRIVIDEKNQTYKVIDNVIYSKDGSKLVYYNNTNKNPIVPDGVKIIGEGAFGWSRIESIDIPNTVTTIEKRAFVAVNIDYLTLPESVTSFGSNCMFGIHNAIYVYANEITHIENGAFIGYANDIYVVNEDIKTIIEEAGIRESETTVRIMEENN